jgi:hypothetical protein
MSLSGALGRDSADIVHIIVLVAIVFTPVPHEQNKISNVNLIEEVLCPSIVRTRPTVEHPVRECLAKPCVAGKKRSFLR